MTPGRLSLNQITTNAWTVEEAIAGCRRAGIPAIGLWRDKVEEAGLGRTARLVADAGLRVSSLCRGGFFTQTGSFDENRRAVDEAAALGADVLVLVCGGLPDGSRDLEAARDAVAEGIAEIVGYASAAGVRLGIEPLHPMYCAERSVVSTLGQAVELASAFPSADVGVIIDVYHVQWDPQLAESISLARGRIFGFHVCDWALPLPAGALLGRALPGDGCIDLPRIATLVASAGYNGLIEIEVMNADVWREPGDQTLQKIVDAVSHMLEQVAINEAQPPL